MIHRLYYVYLFVLVTSLQVIQVVILIAAEVVVVVPAVALIAVKTQMDANMEDGLLEHKRFVTAFFFFFFG